MPHCRAKATPEGNATVAVDNGITLTEQSSINIDVALPLAAAALTAKTIETLDNVTAPKFAELPGAGSNV